MTFPISRHYTTGRSDAVGYNPTVGIVAPHRDDVAGYRAAAFLEFAGYLVAGWALLGSVAALSA